MGREEQTAAGMDVDDTADTVFEKVEDDPHEDDTMSEQEEDEVLDWRAIYTSDHDSKEDTEDELKQHYKLGEHLYSATMLSDEHIPEEGVDRKFATAVQRSLSSIGPRCKKRNARQEIAGTKCQLVAGKSSTQFAK